MSDGVTTTNYTKLTNTSSVTNPIELPVADQTGANIGMFVPVGASPVSATNPTQTVSLTSLIGAPYNYWGDDDGDGQGAGGITATGTLSLVIKDVNGNLVKRNDILTGCDSPYSVTLTSTSGTLMTEYGDPSTTNFTGDSTTYYITPKVIVPYACWAQPNLTYNGGANDSNYYNGPAHEWDYRKGFKLQDIDTPSRNFPTMGAKGLYFNLKVAGALGSDVTYSKSPSTSGIGLTIMGSGNVAKVELTGPVHGVNAVQAGTAVPTTFTLYSDAAQTNAIYSFRIGNWFIAKSGGINYPATQTYCSGFGSGYGVPSVVQYTNANGNGWTGGLLGQPNWYQRTIGGGLFAEWGSMGYYSNSHFENASYWSAEPNGSEQRVTGSTSGGVGSINRFDNVYYRAVCVK